MATIVELNITDSTQYLNISTISSTAGSLLISNDSSAYAHVIVSATQPLIASVGIVVEPFNEAAIYVPSGMYAWMKVDRDSRFVVQPLTQASGDYGIVNLPPSMLTSPLEGYQRVKVDVGQTGYFEGRQFRAFKELSLGAGASYTVKFARSVDINIQTVDLTSDAGSIRMDVYRGATEAGVWSETLANIPVNDRLSRPFPYYVSAAVLTAGGTISGGTLRDTIRVVAANATAQQNTVGGSGAGERGVGADTVGYYKFTNFGTGTATGVFHIAWEERP